RLRVPGRRPVSRVCRSPGLPGRPRRRPAGGAVAPEDLLPAAPRDPGAAARADPRLPARPPRVVRLVRRPPHRPHAEGDARPRGVLPPLRRADRGIHLPADRPVSGDQLARADLKPREDLVRLGEAALALLREHELVADQDVELALQALLDPRSVIGPVVDLCRETTGPGVVAASDGAVEDAGDGH